MNKREQKLRNNAKEIIRHLKKARGKACDELAIGCASCKFGILIAYLEDYVDLLEYE